MAQAAYDPYYSNSWAVIVGINDYKSVGPLTYATHDAEAIADLLISQLDFEKERVHLLLNEDATRENILGVLSNLEKESNAALDDRVVFFFAGHGHTRDGARGPVGFLIPVEGDPSNLGTLIYFDDLVRTSEMLSAKHVLFVMDACYGGVILRRTVQAGIQRLLSDMLQRYSRQVIAAGRADETVADGGGPGGQNSIFTGHLIEGASGEAMSSDGVLTANGLMQYVYEKVSRDPKSEQSPFYGYLDGDGDFILQTPNKEHLGAKIAKDFAILVPDQLAEFNDQESKAKAGVPFHHRNGYSDPDHPSFGRNQWSAKLAEVRRSPKGGDTRTTANSWLSLIAEPKSEGHCQIDIASELDRLPASKPKDSPPFELFAVAPYKQTTIDTAIRYDIFQPDQDSWMSSLRIDRDGNIEFAESHNVFSEFNGVRTFKFVNLIGLCWQFQFLAREILQTNGYELGVRLTINIVGTRDSILADFSKVKAENGKKWLQPFERSYLRQEGSPLDLKCPNPNLQMAYEFSVAELDEELSKGIVVDIAEQLSLAYNHQSSPRCFNFGTTDFPWRQFFQSRTYR